VSGDLSELVRRPSRLRALAALEANAESSANALDRITRLACRSLGVPAVLVNLVGADRQRIIGCESMPPPWDTMQEIPLSHGFCPFALGAEEAFAFADARADPDLADNPAVQRLGVVAYAGVPLRAAGGDPDGTLCASDVVPHQWSSEELGLLTDYAASVIAELQLLSATRQAARHDARLRTLRRLSESLSTAATTQEVGEGIAGAIDPVGGDGIWLMLPDDDGDTLHAVAVASRDGAPPVRPRDLPLDAPLAAAEAARTGQAGFLTTIAAVREHCALESPSPIGAAALLPLHGSAGILGVSFATEREFTSADREYLTTLAGVSGLALRQGLRSG
jgi:GAF domain-containing protein